MSVVEPPRYSDVDPVEGLQTAWSDAQLTLGQRARVVARLHLKSRLSLEGTARICGASPAGVQAILDLATLDDDDLEMVSSANPPITTWFLFAGAEQSWIRAGIDALKLIPAEEPVLLAVYQAMRGTSGPDLDERIAAISAETLGHLAHKAKEYGKLTPRARKFLVDVSNRKRLGSPLTERQLDWLRSILFELVENGVVCRDSPDNDDEPCSEVLEALQM